MAKRKTKKQKIKAASRVESAPTIPGRYSLPEAYATKTVEISSRREVYDLATLSYGWVGRDIRKSLIVSGIIFLGFALLNIAF